MFILLDVQFNLKLLHIAPTHEKVYDCNVLHSTLCLICLNCLSDNFLLGIELNVKHCNHIDGSIKPWLNGLNHI